MNIGHLGNPDYDVSPHVRVDYVPSRTLGSQMTAAKDLRPLLQPKCIAVVGASERLGAGSIVIENLVSLGYGGKIIAINPSYSSVLGLPCYSSLQDVPPQENIDCIAILLGHAQVIPILEQAAHRGVRGAWAFASGFAETGEEGAELQKRLRRLCLENEIMFCGPNCVGYVNLHDQVGVLTAPISPALRKGKIGAVAQSGSVILALANSNRGIGFSALISSGNEAVLDTADYFEYFLEDENTEVIIAFLEGIRRPDAFVRVCERAAELNKPIIVVKIGRSELAQKTVVTHTGALAGSDMVHDAFFKKLGVIRVHDLDQLLETAEAFVRCKNHLPKGNRVGAIGVSGGEIGLIGDLAEEFDISFPSLSLVAQKELRDRLPSFTVVDNPLDAWGSGDLVETYPACLEVLAREAGIDLIAVSQDSPLGMAETQVNQYADVARAVVRTASSGKPIVVFSHVSGGLDPTIKGILDQGGIPFLQGSRESLMAIDRLIEYARFQKKKKVKENIHGNSPDHVERIIESLKGRRRILPYAQSKEVITAYGLEVVEEVLAQSVDQALEAAQTIGYPVVLKGQSTQIPHKTDAALIRLNVKTHAELRASFEEISKNVRQHDSTAVLDGILIQDMISQEAVEVILGISTDPLLGPFVVFGMGGIFVELLKDTCVQLPQITLNEAHAMISGLKGKSLLEGFRGKAQADIDSLANALVQVGRMASDLKDGLVSLDLNPLMVLPGTRGVRVVDILMEVGG